MIIESARATKIQVVDSNRIPRIAEIGDCGKGVDDHGRNKCGHRHIEPERFIDIRDGWTAKAQDIGINLMHGRDMRGPTFKAKDAQEALFFMISQLAYTEAGLFERDYIPMQYKDFVPLDFSAGEAAETIRYEIYDESGNAQDVSPAADDVPTADSFYADKTFPVNPAAIGYAYTTQELRATAFLRRPLPERKVHAAENAYERFLNVVGLLGRASKGVTGFLNNTNVTHAVSPSGLAWSGSSGITPAQIVNDFNFGMYSVYSGSSFTVIPDTVAIPPAAWQYIQALPAIGSSSGSFNKSLLTYLEENNLSKSLGVSVKIVPCFDARPTDTLGGQAHTGPGAGGTSRTVYYRKSDQDLIMHIPLPLRFLAPQLFGLKVKVPGEFRYSGVEIRRPPSFYYQDGN